MNNIALVAHTGHSVVYIPLGQHHIVLHFFEYAYIFSISMYSQYVCYIKIELMCAAGQGTTASQPSVSASVGLSTSAKHQVP